jgi:hypothetical protein
MAITGKTGADAFYKNVKHQAQLWAKYGPKLAAVCQTMHTAGLLDTTEYTALIAAFNAVPAILAAIAKVADYSGFSE